MSKDTVLIDKVIETSKGELRILIDYEFFLTDLEKYSDRLRIARAIPFDLDNISPSDPAIMAASKIMDWTDDTVAIVESVKRHYAGLDAQARKDAMVLAATRKNSIFEFEPKPYDPVRVQEEEWEVSLPVSERNLNDPIERRLKQIFDLLSESQDTFRSFYQMMQTVFIQAERKARQAKTDEDGFHPGRSGGTVHPKVISGRVQSKARNERPGVVGLPGGDANPQHEGEG